MPFHLANDWQQRGLQLQSIKDKCNDIIDALNLPKDDARNQAMVHVRQFCNTLAAVPIKLSQNAEIGNNVPIIMTLLGLTKKDDLKSCLGDLNHNSKASFVTMVQFALENCVVRILHAMPGEPDQGNFKASCQRLLTVAGLSNASAKHQILLVPAWIRNSLHAAGIHGRASKTVVIDGEPYEFKKGGRICCASWSHLFHAFRNGLDIYEEVLTSSSVSVLSRVRAAS